MWLYRSFKQWVCRMLRWAHQQMSLARFRQVVSGSWFYVGRIVLLLVVPLFAIRYLLRARGGRPEPGNDEGSAPRSSSGNDETPAQVSPESVPDFEQNSVRAPGEDERATEERLSPTDDYPADDYPADDYLTDDYLCEYDSTWDSDDESQEEDTRDLCQDDREENREENPEENPEKSPERVAPTWNISTGSQSYKYKTFESAAKDLQNYRHDYPIKPYQRWNIRATDEYPNLNFYLGNRYSSPDNLDINHFHTSWKGNYDTLESVHSYIQWLFPLQEPGVNPEAYTLTKKEIEEFCRNDVARNRLLESYKLMLDFYGIELCDEETGEVQRASNWKKRFTNLNRRTHNNLRITRILKCLGTLGFAHYQAPLVHFFLKETLVNGELPYVKNSVLNYFLFTVLDKKQRRKLLKFAYLNFDEREEFVWCPKRIQMKWSRLKTPRPESSKVNLSDN